MSLAAGYVDSFFGFEGEDAFCIREDYNFDKNALAATGWAEIVGFAAAKQERIEQGEDRRSRRSKVDDAGGLAEASQQPKKPKISLSVPKLTRSNKKSTRQVLYLPTPAGVAEVETYSHIEQALALVDPKLARQSVMVRAGEMWQKCRESLDEGRFAQMAREMELGELAAEAAAPAKTGAEPESPTAPASKPRFALWGGRSARERPPSGISPSPLPPPAAASESAVNAVIMAAARFYDGELPPATSAEEAKARATRSAIICADAAEQARNRSRHSQALDPETADQLEA